MTQAEKEILINCINDVRNSDDQIEPLVRLYEAVKRLLKIK